MPNEQEQISTPDEQIKVESPDDLQSQANVHRQAIHNAEVTTTQCVTAASSESIHADKMSNSPFSCYVADCSHSRRNGCKDWVAPPKDTKERAKWATAIRRNEIPEWARICGCHFEPASYKYGPIFFEYNNYGNMIINPPASWPMNLAKHIRDMQASGFLCDVRVHSVDGVMFQFHSVVLAAASPVMMGVLQTERASEVSGVTMYSDYNSDVWKVLVDFLYKSSYKVSKECYADLMEFVDELQLKDLKRQIFSDPLSIAKKVKNVDPPQQSPMRQILSSPMMAPTPVLLTRVEPVTPVSKAKVNNPRKLMADEAYKMFKQRKLENSGTKRKPQTTINDDFVETYDLYSGIHGSVRSKRITEKLKSRGEQMQTKARKRRNSDNDPDWSPTEGPSISRKSDRPLISNADEDIVIPIDDIKTEKDDDADYYQHDTMGSPGTRGASHQSGLRRVKVSDILANQPAVKVSDIKMEKRFEFDGKKADYFIGEYSKRRQVSSDDSDTDSSPEDGGRKHSSYSTEKMSVLSPSGKEIEVSVEINRHKPGPACSKIGKDLKSWSLLTSAQPSALGSAGHQQKAGRPKLMETEQKGVSLLKPSISPRAPLVQSKVNAKSTNTSEPANIVGKSFLGSSLSTSPMVSTTIYVDSMLLELCPPEQQKALMTSLHAAIMKQVNSVDIGEEGESKTQGKYRNIKTFVSLKPTADQANKSPSTAQNQFTVSYYSQIEYTDSPPKNGGGGVYVERMQKDEKVEGDGKPSAAVEKKRNESLAYLRNVLRAKESQPAKQNSNNASSGLDRTKEWVEKNTPIVISPDDTNEQADTNVAQKTTEDNGGTSENADETDDNQDATEDPNSENKAPSNDAQQESEDNLSASVNDQSQPDKNASPSQLEDTDSAALNADLNAETSELNTPSEQEDNTANEVQENTENDDGEQVEGDSQEVMEEQDHANVTEIGDEGLDNLEDPTQEDNVDDVMEDDDLVESHENGAEVNEQDSFNEEEGGGEDEMDDVAQDGLENVEETSPDVNSEGDKEIAQTMETE